MGSYFAPQHGQQGPFEDAVMGEPIHIDDWSPQHDHFNNHGGGGGGNKQKKNNSNANNKKKNGNNSNNYDNQYENDRYRQPIQSRYEGFTIEKAAPPKGQKSTWTRTGRKAIQVGQKDLKKIVDNGNWQKHWAKLGSTQHDVVNRLLDQKKLDENDRNAIWSMADCYVTTVGGGFMSAQKPKVAKIRVVLERRDKDGQMSSRSRGVREFKQFSPDEIIDLNKPLKSKNKEGRQGKNKGQGNNNYDNQGHFDEWDDHNHHPGGNNHNNNFHHPQGPPMMHPAPMNPQFDNFAPQPQQVPIHDPYAQMNPAAFPPPQAPMAHDHQFPQQGPPPFQRNGSNRQPQFGNPFQPEPHINFQPGFDQHDLFSNDEFGPQGPSARERSRSRPALERRRSSNRRNSRQVEQLEDQVSELHTRMNQMALQVEQARGAGSSEDTYSDRDSVWSQDNNRRGRRDRDYSPPSSRGSLEHARRNTTTSRNRSGYRSKKYYDTDLVPARTYSYRENGLRRRGSAHRRRSSGRLALHQSRTVADDYPQSRATQSRYISGGPRRVIEIDERYDYEREGGRNGGGDRRRSMIGYESFDEGYA